MNFGLLDSLLTAESSELFDMGESLLIDKLSYSVKTENIKSLSTTLSETFSVGFAPTFSGDKAFRSPGLIGCNS